MKFFYYFWWKVIQTIHKSSQYNVWIAIWGYGSLFLISLAGYRDPLWLLEAFCRAAATYLCTSLLVFPNHLIGIGGFLAEHGWSGNIAWLRSQIGFPRVGRFTNTGFHGIKWYHEALMSSQAVHQRRYNYRNWSRPYHFVMGWSVTAQLEYTPESLYDHPMTRNPENPNER